MEKWIQLMLIVFNLSNLSSNLEEMSRCSIENIEEHVTCKSRISLKYLKVSSHNLLKCENCCLGFSNSSLFTSLSDDITFLDLTGSNITSVKNYSFKKFKFLKILRLSNNLLRELKENIFYGISSLQQLDLSQNYISNIPEEAFVSLVNLDVLNISRNCIISFDENVFVGLTRLKFLYLNYNKLIRLNAYSFKQLNNLKVLYLENNYINAIHPLAFSGLKNLNYLYMNNNSVSSLLQYTFKPLINLVDLQLRFNNLPKVPSSAFNGLRRLKTLYLGGNHLTVIRPYGFVGLNHLENLELIGNKFQYFTLDYLKDLKKLLYVWLEDNSITNFTIEVDFDSEIPLEVLDLRNNSIENINFKLLHQKLPKLKLIRMGNNNLQCFFALNMYNYFNDADVFVCFTNSCNLNETEFFLREICKFTTLENKTEVISTEGDVENHGNVISNSIILYFLFLIHLSYLYY